MGSFEGYSKQHFNLLDSNTLDVINFLISYFQIVSVSLFKLNHVTNDTFKLAHRSLKRPNVQAICSKWFNWAEVRLLSVCRIFYYRFAFYRFPLGRVNATIIGPTVPMASFYICTLWTISLWILYTYTETGAVPLVAINIHL